MDWLIELLKKEFGELEGAKKKIDSAIEAVKSEFPKHAVPKEQYNKKAEKAKELESELETAQGKYKEAAEKLDDLSKKADGNEELKAEFQKVKAEYEEYKAGEEKRVQQIQARANVEKELLKNDADKNAVDLLMNDFDLEKIRITDDGKLDGFSDQLKAVKEKRPTLFAHENYEDDQPKKRRGEGGGEGRESKYFFLGKSAPKKQ